MAITGKSFQVLMADFEICSGRELKVKSMKLSRFYSVSILTNDFSWLAYITSVGKGVYYSPKMQEPERVFLTTLSLLSVDPELLESWISNLDNF
jgi:hypothetical protein